MTFTKALPLMTAAVIMCAAPASAQIDTLPTAPQTMPQKIDAQTMAKEKAMDAAKEKAMDAAKNKTPEISHNMGNDMDHTLAQEPNIKMDDMASSAPKMQAPAPNAPTTDMPAPATTVLISCPAGTTAQDDGTCMVTGDYKG